MYGIMGLKKGGKTRATGWTPGKGGSKASKDYYREKKKEYTSPQAVASRDLDQIVRAGKEDQDYKGGTSGAGRVIADMSKKNQDFMMRNRRKDGSFNSAARALLDSRWDDRSDYQRDLNKFIKSGPAAKEAYLERFPIGGRINLGIPAAFNALSKMAIPAPIRALGTIAKDVATLGGRGLKALVPKGIRKDLGFHKNKFMNDLSNAGPGIKNDFKTKLGLNSTQESLLNTINKEMTSSQKDAQELLQAQNEDWSDAILGDDIKDAENKIMDNAEKELDELAIAYKPGQDVDTRYSGPYEVEDWMGEIQPRISVEEDIFDVSQPVLPRNRMPHVPITREQKVKAVDEGYAVGPWGDWVGDDATLDLFYNEMREAQEKGMEYGPWKGVVAESPFEEWQQPGTREIQDQIRWNTANRPLDTSYWEQPELDEEFIQDNIKTGSDLWSSNQTRSNIPGGEDEVAEVGLPMDMGWQTNPYEKLSLDELIDLGASEDQIADYLNISQAAGGGYLKKYDDGGYANMSTFEKLKAINDSIADG